MGNRPAQQPALVGPSFGLADTSPPPGCHAIIRQQSGVVIGDRLARNGRNCANGHHAKPDAYELNRWLSDKDRAGDG